MFIAPSPNPTLRGSDSTTHLFSRNVCRRTSVYSRSKIYTEATPSVFFAKMVPIRPTPTLDFTLCMARTKLSCEQCALEFYPIRPTNSKNNKGSDKGVRFLLSFPDDPITSFRGGYKNLVCQRLPPFPSTTVMLQHHNLHRYLCVHPPFHSDAHDFADRDSNCRCYRYSRYAYIGDFTRCWVPRENSGGAS